MRCELGHCGPPAGVAGAGGSSAFSVGSTSRMQMRRNWQEGCAGGKAKKSYPPRAACCGPSDRNCPGGSGSPSSSALLHEIGSHLATSRIPLPAARPGSAPAVGTEIGLQRSPWSFLHTSQKQGWQRVHARLQTLNPCANLPGAMEKQTRRSPERAAVVVKATSE